MIVDLTASEIRILCALVIDQDNQGILMQIPSNRMSRDLKQALLAKLHEALAKSPVTNDHKTFQ